MSRLLTPPRSWVPAPDLAAYAAELWGTLDGYHPNRRNKARDTELRWLAWHIEPLNEQLVTLAMDDALKASKGHFPSVTEWAAACAARTPTSARPVGAAPAPVDDRWLEPWMRAQADRYEAIADAVLAGAGFGDELPAGAIAGTVGRHLGELLEVHLRRLRKLHGEQGVADFWREWAAGGGLTCAQITEGTRFLVAKAARAQQERAA